MLSWSYLVIRFRSLERSWSPEIRLEVLGSSLVAVGSSDITKWFIPSTLMSKINWLQSILVWKTSSSLSISSNQILRVRLEKGSLLSKGHLTS